MSKVTDCARALGQAIVDSEEYKAMQITEKTAMNDPAVAAAMSRYLEAKDGMHTAMSAGNADEIARFSQEMDDAAARATVLPAAAATNGIKAKEKA